MHREEMTRAAADRGIPDTFLNRHWADWRYHDLCDILDFFQTPRHHRGDSRPRETKIELAVRVYSFFATWNADLVRSELAKMLGEFMYLYPQIETGTPFNRTYSNHLTALVDSGFSYNVVSDEVVDFFQLDPANGFPVETVTSVIGVTGDRLDLTGPYLIWILLQDSHGRTLMSHILFYAGNIQPVGFDMILGRPWIVSQTRGMNPRTRRWRFADNRLDVNMEFPMADQQEEDDLEHGRDGDASTSSSSSSSSPSSSSASSEAEEEDDVEDWSGGAEEDDDSGEDQEFYEQGEEEFDSGEDQEFDSEDDEEYHEEDDGDDDL